MTYRCIGTYNAVGGSLVGHGINELQLISCHSVRMHDVSVSVKCGLNPIYYGVSDLNFLCV